MKVKALLVVFSLVAAFVMAGCGSKDETADAVNQAPAPKNAEGMTTSEQGGAASSEDGGARRSGG